MVLLIVSAKQTHLFAQSNSQPQIKFKGFIQDVDRHRSYSKIIVLSDRNDWFPGTDSSILIQKNIDSNGTFEFSLPNLNKPIKFNLVVRDNENKNASQYLYYAEPGDEVNIKIYQTKGRDSILFDGKGFGKYKLAYQLQDQFYKEYFPSLNSIKLLTSKDSATLKNKMQLLYQLLVKSKERKKQSSESEDINPLMRNILYHEFAEYDSEWIFRTQLIYNQEPDLRNQLASIYRRHRMEFFDKPDSSVRYCSLYFSRLASRITLEMMLNNHSDKINLKSYYDTIKVSYSGILRERMLGYVFFNRSTGMNSTYSPVLMDSLIRDAKKMISLSYIKRALDKQEVSHNKVNYHQVIDAQFTDLNGKVVYISALKGKVVLIDTWFNGCFGCAQFYEIFEKEIYPQFRNNKNFVVLSINIDKDKKRWQSGINGKLYSSESYLNVTTGNGFEHPFFKYYGVTGSPWFMLIDANGDICYQPNGTSVKEMSEKISEALAKIPIE